MVVLDTNVIIDHLRQVGVIETLLMKIAGRLAKENLALSVISIQELYEGQSTKDEIKENLLMATITPLKILSYTYEIAQLAGEITRDLKHPVELADSAIAATTILNGGKLLTLNKKDFLGIAELEFYEL